jgi:hypothetical protein
MMRLQVAVDLTDFNLELAYRENRPKTGQETPGFQQILEPPR